MTESDIKNTGAGIKCDQSKCFVFQYLNPHEQKKLEREKLDIFNGKKDSIGPCASCIAGQEHDDIKNIQVKERPQTELQSVT
jgi:hypothetical protein